MDTTLLKIFSREWHKQRLNFLVAPPLPSGATYLVTTASVCMSVCMYGCSLVEIFFTKGFFFDTRFGLIHVKTEKKIFCKKFF